MDISHYVRTYNLVPKATCESVISMYENDKDWQEHNWYNSASDSKNTQHNKELDVLYNRNLDVLGPYLFEAVKAYYADLGVTALVTNHSRIRLNKYKTGTIMSEHFDLIRRNQTDGIPVLTFLGSLNDNFSGGEFMMNRKELKLRQGDITVFPSTFLYPHGVQEVTEGTRYTFVAWGY